MALAASGNQTAAASFAGSRWGVSIDWESVVKSAVTPLTVANLDGEQSFAAAEYFETVRQASIVGRLVGRRDVPLRTRLINVGSGARGYWVGQSKPKPLSKPTLAGAVMDPRKVAAIIVATAESVKAPGPKAEAVFQSDLTRAVAEELDTAFIDSANAGIAGEMPASITNGVTHLASSGNPGSDITALIEHFLGDLSVAVFITDPVTATRIALARDAGGSFLFPDVGPRGGSILGMPLLTSRSSPQDSSGGQLALVDPSGIATALEGVSVDLSEHSTLQMSDTPDSPLDANTVLVSLWQQDLVALRAEIYANWRVEREGAVAVVTGASYATEAA
jgi:HK97 family phage major capsid protein